MRFVVRPNRAPQVKRSYPLAVIHPDSWDDYGFKSSFRVEIFLSRRNKIDLGVVKILRRDQKSGRTPFPKRVFTKLGYEYYSLGQDISYYQKLRSLGHRVYDPFLKGMRDTVYNSGIKSRSESSEGFQVSLTRFSAASLALTEGPQLFQDAISIEPPTSSRWDSDLVFEFWTRVSNEADSFRIKFDFGMAGKLPNRLIAIIGYNGTGKTQLLSNLATVASGYGYRSREEILEEQFGRFVGEAPPFKTVVVVSYSAFDSFEIPGRSALERRQLKASGEVFGYVYCGLRETLNYGSNSKRGYRLKSQAEITEDFVDAFERIQRSSRGAVYLEALAPLLRDASFQRIGLTEGLFADGNRIVLDSFDSLSSGHKVVLKIITQIVANVHGNEPSLVLVDEPESHLHPPLLASLLQCIRIALDRLNAYAVVATHSPVVLQETPARYVLVVRRFDNSSYVDGLQIETFGENIGAITQEVFNLNDGSADWHHTLRRMAQYWSLDQIETMLGRRLGFTARSYLLDMPPRLERKD